MRHQSKKHDEVIKLIVKKTNGIRTDNCPLKKGCSYPDIVLPDRDIEVEMFHTSNLKRKCLNYDKRRKRTMIVVISEDIKEYFDKVVLWDAESFKL